MRRTRIIAVRVAACLSAVALTGATTSNTQPGQLPVAAGQDGTSGYVVLAKEGVSPQAVADELAAAGAAVTSVNTAIGMVTVSSAPGGFAATARSLPGVQAAGADRVVGHAPKREVTDRVLKENKYEPGLSASASPPTKNGRAAASDPLDSNLWGLDLINAPAAHRSSWGTRGCASAFSTPASTPPTPTWPPTSTPSCPATSVRPARHRRSVRGAQLRRPGDRDDNGHGTHVAGTIAAAMNGFGVSGVAPNVGLVNIRGGQDSGYFFLGPVVNALTYAGDVGIDVVNMSFYVDPWLYNCSGGAPEDIPERPRTRHHHRGDEPGPELRAPQERHPGLRAWQRARRSRPPEDGHHQPGLPCRVYAPADNRQRHLLSTCPPRARTSSESPRWARQGRRPTTRTTRPSAGQARLRCPRQAGASGMASGRPPTGRTGT